jgi:serine/threonine protein kinase
MNAITADPKAIFFAALDQPSSAERLRYVDEACGSNSQLRSRVEQLLAAHDQAGQFLGGSGATINTPLPERPGTQIGPYKLLQQIGEGGCGVVYMAEQAVLTSLDIDTRSDIYSLGVLLYELLTGKTPFDAKELLAAGLDEMRRTIREVEPVKPSTRLTQGLNSKSEISEIRNAKLSVSPSGSSKRGREARRL